MQQIFRNSIITFLCFFCFVLFLTGCQNESPPPEPAKPAVQKVTLQLQWVTQTQFAGYYVALEKGWYLDEKIDLTIHQGGPDIMPIDLVSSGIRDFGTALLSDLTVEVQNSKPVISIGQIQQANGLILIAKKSSGIETPKDFPGKRVGIWFQGFEAQFNALLAREKVPINDIEIASQGWSMTPFIKGRLDVASAMIYNEYYAVIESGIKPSELNIIDYRSYGLDFPGDTLFTSQKLLKTNQDLCIRMLRASLKGWKYAIEHPEEAVDIVLKHDSNGIQKRSHQLVMMKEISKLVQVQGHPIGKTDPDAVSRMLKTLSQHNILKEALLPENIYQADILLKAASQ